MSRFDRFLKLLTGTSDQPEAWHDTEPWLRLGTRLAVLVVGGLLVWSVVVSINGAVIATGHVGVEGQHKTIQHLDGGIVADILVRNGDRVTRDQPLLRLDDTAARAARDTTLAKIHELLIQRARLEAELQRADHFAVPAAVPTGDPKAQLGRTLATQKALFAARKAAHDGERAMLIQRLGQSRREREGLTALIAGRRKEVALNAEEVANLAPLQKRGLVSVQRMSPLLRESARLEGEVGRLRSELARTEGAIAEAELRLAQSEKDFTERAVDELRKLETALTELTENQKALDAKLSRTWIRAPVAGRVHALASHTIGGVVTPAAAILQIVPDDVPMRIEAQLKPSDIDRVREGQPASVRFSTFNARSTPRLEGTVVAVSPAQLNDGQGRAYFTAEIELPASETARLGAQHKLVPGMPAEVFITTAAHSMLSYFVKPLTDAVMHAFREG